MPAQHTNNTADEQRSEALLSTAPERAILVGVDMPGGDWPVEESLDELAQLASTAGVTTADRVIQRLPKPHPGTLLGSGKIQEIAELVRYHNCDAVIFDLELSPGQHRTLEAAIEAQVLDRTALILMTSPAARTRLPRGQTIPPGPAGAWESGATGGGKPGSATHSTSLAEKEGVLYGGTTI